jgi:hypothetical protein
MEVHNLLTTWNLAYGLPRLARDHETESYSSQNLLWLATVNMLQIIIITIIINVYNGYKFCSLLDIIGNRVPYRNFRAFPLFTVGASRKNCPSVRCPSAANTACKDVEKFSKHLVTLKHIFSNFLC